MLSARLIRALGGFHLYLCYKSIVWRLGMGITICPNHGRSGFFETCEHVDAQLKSGHAEDFHCIINMLWCDDCWKKYDLAEVAIFEDLIEQDDDQGDELLDKYMTIYNNIRRQGWCEKCIAEIQGENWYEMTRTRRPTTH
jgi:hypothetical protein